ncbi:YppG family protein [Cytobacillus purgationiresistens]|uniref:YppG-like protein n=1 Tax=Cytobacillus purgationiresistens TaxID=863449 RepID=A0ABU0AIF3_9BACI|nr:YppG family protein [Cytobacillus purgationiresistens]MDQ0271036.1 hypothetical protein [Cytobacillus purgationiresistens]
MFSRKRQRASNNQTPANWSYGNIYAPNNMNMSNFQQMRQQPYMNYAGTQNNWNPQAPLMPYMEMQAYQGSYPLQGGGQMPYSSLPQQGYPGAQPTYQGYEMNHTTGQYSANTQNVFQNPLAPEEETVSKNPQSQSSYPYMNPYPKQSFVAKQPSGVQSIMNSFKSQDGSLDFNKMMDTAGQMMNAVNQMSSMVKGVGGFFKV